MIDKRSLHGNYSRRELNKQPPGRPAKFGSLTLELQVAKCWLSCQHCYAGEFAVRKEQTALNKIVECLEFFMPVVETLPSVYLYKDIIEYHALAEFLQILKCLKLDQSYELLPTHGWVRPPSKLPLIVRTLAANGVNTLWLTVHGDQQQHDAFVRRPGAYAQMLSFAKAAERAGIGVFWNLMLRRNNFAELARHFTDPEIASISKDFYVSTPGNLGYGKKLAEERPSINAIWSFRERGAKLSTDIFSEATWIHRIADMNRLSSKVAREPYVEIRVLPDGLVSLHDFPRSRPIGRIGKSSREQVVEEILNYPGLINEIRQPQPGAELIALCKDYGNVESDTAHCIYSLAATWAERAMRSGDAPYDLSHSIPVLRLDGVVN